MDDITKQANKITNQKFLEALGDSKWAEVAEIIEKLDEIPGFWQNILIMDAVKDDWKKRFVRRKIKQLRVDGFPLFASIETKNKEGDLIRVYKREDSFIPEDFQKAAEYHGSVTVYHAKMARHYADGYESATGKQILLPFTNEAFID